MENNRLKGCTMCGTTKDISEFYKEKNKPGGLHSKCKACMKKYYEENKKRFKKYHQENKHTSRHKFTELKASAKKRGLEVSISFEQYVELIKTLNCYYCDANFSNETGGNLNRIDSSKGYLINNVNPCCATCNKIMNRFTVKELKARLIKIYRRLK